MAVTKRTRYEVMRRDGHKCRYCGAAAEDSPLTIDHVVPRALGGSDDPSNLVAACKDCNAGKTSANPDSEQVAQVAQDAVRWSQAMRQAAEEAAVARADRLEAVAPFREAWVTVMGSSPLPLGWDASVTQWLDIGLTMEDLFDLIPISNNKKVGWSDRFSYFAGCCWNTIKERQLRAGRIVHENDSDAYMLGYDAGCESASLARERLRASVSQPLGESNEEPTGSYQDGFDDALYAIGRIHAVVEVRSLCEAFVYGARNMLVDGSNLSWREMVNMPSFQDLPEWIKELVFSPIDIVSHRLKRENSSEPLPTWDPVEGVVR